MTALLLLSAAVVILLAGTNLSRYGDVVAGRSGLGRTWIGLVLTASITSLPELATGLSAVVSHRAPDMAVGDVGGSLVFNLLLLVVVDVLCPAGTPSPDHRSGHWILLGMGALGMCLVAAGLAWTPLLPRIGWVGSPTILLGVLYVIALRWVFARNRDREPDSLTAGGISLRKAAGLYAVNAVLVIAAAVFLPRLAVDLAEATGWGQTFVGSAIVGATTSLPEIAVTVAAVRLRAIDLAIGGLLGSNLFDLLLLAVGDVMYTPGPILGAVGAAHLVPILASLLMSGTLARAWRSRNWPRQGGRGSWASLTIAGIYGMHLVVLYALRAR